jgi:PHO85 cyclin-6/7
MGSLVIGQLVSDLNHYPYTMLGGDSHQTSTSDQTSQSSRSHTHQTPSASSRSALAAATPISASNPSTAATLPFPNTTPQTFTQSTHLINAVPIPIPSQNPDRAPSAPMRQLFPPSPQPPEHPTYHEESLNQHLQGFDQSGFPLTTNPRGLIASSPSSPRLQPTYRSTRSLGGSEATSPSRIKVRDLSHIQSFASEELLGQSRLGPRSGRGFQDVGRQYEISSMPVADIIEMVAGLLTKITTTNDQQHEHLHRHIPPPEGTAGLSQQTTSVLAFHGKNVPSITILSYLSRIHKYCPTTYEVFLSLLVYFDRMTERVNKGYLQTMWHGTGELSQSAPGQRTQLSSVGSRDYPEISTPSSSGDGLPTAHHGRPPPPIPQAHSGGHEEPESLSHFFVVDSFNIHRLVIAGVTCASKFFSDVFYTNSRYAKVSTASHCIQFGF